MNSRQRTLILLSVGIPLFLSAIVAALTSDSQNWIVVASVLLGSLVSTIVIWLLTRESTQVYQLAILLKSNFLDIHEDHETVSNLFQNQVGGKFRSNAVVEVLRSLCERLTVRRQQIKDSIAAIASNLLVMSDATKKIPPVPGVSIPDENISKMLDSAYRNVSNHLQVIRLREAAFASILRDLPTPLLVTDRSYRVLSTNQAAQKLFGLNNKQLQKSTLSQLFVGPEQLPVSSDPFELRPHNALSAIGNLKRKSGTEVNAVVRTALGKPLQVSLRAFFGENFLFNMRDVSEERQSEAKARESHRKGAINRLANYLCEATSSSIEQAKNQSRVLASIVKRMPQNAQALPPLLSNVQELDRLSIINQLMLWIVRAENKNLALGEPEELKLSEVVDTVLNRFKCMISESESEVEVIDQGAWIFSDQELVEAVLAGILIHAIGAKNKTAIQLYLKRTDSRGDDSMSLVCMYEAQQLSKQFESDYLNPYARFDSLLFDHENPGSLLGLYVARLLTELLGGSLQCENLLGGPCKITATLPCRPQMSTESSSSAFSTIDPANATLGEFAFGPKRLPEEDGSVGLATLELTRETGELENTSLDLSLNETTIVGETLGDWRFGD